MAASRFSEAIAPGYLLLCLVLGGSAQGVWANLVLQLIAIALLAWAALSTRSDPLSADARRLFVILSLGLLLIAIQLLPLPPNIWSHLPGRAVIADGYATLGMPLPWLPLTMAVDETLVSILRLLPAAAILVVMVRLNAYRVSWLAGAIIIGTIGGVLLGALQVTGEASANSPYYLYRVSNFGVATGFFANSNHMASLLVVTIPFLFALLSTNRKRDGKGGLQRQTSVYALVLGSVLVVLLGLILNGSLAGFGLAVPVLVASVLLLAGWKFQRRWVAVPVGLLIAVTMAGLALPTSAQLDRMGAAGSVESRQELAATTWNAITTVLPIGSGLGSFESVYRLHENADSVDRTYVNHAHNDYLEIFLEAGIPGLILLAAFLLWWGIMAIGRWRDNLADPFVKAAVIASAALLAHSLVDFPLRTSALSALFAATLAMMAGANRAPPQSSADLRPARHLEIR